MLHLCDVEFLTEVMVKMRDVKSLSTLGRVVVPSSSRSSSQRGVTYGKTCISLFYNMRF